MDLYAIRARGSRGAAALLTVRAVGFSNLAGGKPRATGSDVRYAVRLARKSGEPVAIGTFGTLAQAREAADLLAADPRLWPTR